jgi:hypothetical protein
MFDFLRRIPAMLGLKSRAKPQSAGAAKVAMPAKAANSNKPNQPMRGRGTGRGLTPPMKPKPSANQRRGKR